MRTLGSLDLQDSAGEGITSILSQPKRFALLVYLATARPIGLHRRDTLLSLFWPERDDAHARNALSQSLSYLRRNLSEGALVGRGPEEIGLTPGLVQVDAVEFDQAVAAER